MIYQEDVSRVAVALAGFSHTEADGLRKVMARKDRDRQMPDYKDRFFSGARARGLSNATLKSRIDTVIDLARIEQVLEKPISKLSRGYRQRVGLADWKRRRVEALSKGMQQKLQFIATLLHEPELVILEGIPHALQAAAQAPGRVAPAAPCQLQGIVAAERRLLVAIFIAHRARHHLFDVPLHQQVNLL